MNLESSVLRETSHTEKTNTAGSHLYVELGLIKVQGCSQSLSFEWPGFSAQAWNEKKNYQSPGWVLKVCPSMHTAWKQRLRGLRVFNETSNMGCLLGYKQAFSGHTQGKHPYHTESVSEIIQQMMTRKTSGRRNLMSHFTMLYLHFLVFNSNNKTRDTQRNRRRCLVTYKEISR